MIEKPIVQETDDTEDFQISAASPHGTEETSDTNDELLPLAESWEVFGGSNNVGIDCDTVQISGALGADARWFLSIDSSIM